MPILVVLLPSEADVSLDPDTAGELAELGVTSVALTRDDEGHGLVLEGWAFDPDRSAEAACALVSHGSADGRYLRQVMHVAVSASSVSGDGARERGIAQGEED